MKFFKEKKSIDIGIKFLKKFIKPVLYLYQAHRNFSTQASIWATFHPTRENILLFITVDMSI